MLTRIRLALGRLLGVPGPLAAPAPALWLLAAALARALGAERWEALATGRYLKVAVRLARSSHVR